MMKEYRHSYATLKHVATTHYSDNNFCSVIAVAVATNNSFGKVFNAYKRLGRRARCGTYQSQQLKVLKSFGKGLEIDVNKTFKFKTLKTLSKHCGDWEGVYLVYVRGHVACIRDGILEDWSDNYLGRIKYIYKVIPNNLTN